MIAVLAHPIQPGQIWRNNATGKAMHILRVGSHWLCARPNGGGEVRYMSIRIFRDEYTRVSTIPA